MHLWLPGEILRSASLIRKLKFCLKLVVNVCYLLPKICRFCWHRIRSESDDQNGLCPACRKVYTENPANFKPLSTEDIQKLKVQKRKQDQQKKQKSENGKRHLADLRVVQKNLVFVVGISPRIADPDVLKKNEFFGKFGKIHKVVVNPCLQVLQGTMNIGL